MDIIYSQCFEMMPCYLTIQDHDFKIIQANRKFRQELGEFKGRRCYEIYKHRTEKCEDCPVNSTFEDGLCHQSEGKVTKLAGEQISVIVYTTPLQSENGEISAVMKMSTDITDIKQIQKQLQESKERYHLIFDEVPCYISIQDRDLQVIEANRRFIEDFGQINGRKCFEVYKHRKKECVPCPVKQTFQDGKIRQSEEIVTSINGNPMNVLVSAAPVRNNRGEIKSVMEMSANITQIRELQSQLTSIGLLVGSISHGIRGELSGLDGGKYLVKTGMKKNDMSRIEKGWEMVERNFDRIRSMVLDILYYAKDREPKWETLSALTIADDVFKTITGKDQAKEIELCKDFDRDAGDFEADRQAVRSMLINLLENSIDACRVDKSKSVHRVKFSVRGTPECIEFMIKDNGVGMEQEAREKAFSLFFSSKGAEGTGLGLFVANKIAKAHNGSIQIDSEVGEGAAFIVKIPRRKPVK